MSSFDCGKEFVTGWIHGKMKKGETCLDVGPCDGNWFNRLGDYLVMDAVEIYQPNIDFHRLNEKYRQCWCMDIDEFRCEWYDLFLFGDVIEHMDVEKAQRVLEYAKQRSKYIIVAVPFLYRQGANYGNQWETHIQEDLTPELFAERYHGFEMIHRPLPNYAYYVWENQLADATS